MQKSKLNQKTQKAPQATEAPKKEKVKKNTKPKVEDDEEEVEMQKNIDQVMEEDVSEDEKPQRPKKQKKAKAVVKEESDDDDEEGDEGVYAVELGDDDFYIPQKKIKVAQNKEKVVKAQKPKGNMEEEKQATANKSNEKKSNNKADRFSKKNKDDEKAQRGILYVGHLPYGFVEEGLKEFFQQYGEILNIHLARSKKTARSMGFAFIEFKYKDVAKVAADAMNGYMFYGKKLACRVIEDDEGIKVHTKKFKFIPFNKKFIEQKNMQKDPSQARREVKSLLKLEERRRQKIKELNIDYDFPGFKAAIDEAKQRIESADN